MTLEDAIREVRCDPDDVSSPFLRVYWDDVDSEQERYLLGSEYARRPYVILEELTGTLQDAVHNAADTFRVVVDLHILQPIDEDGNIPPRAVINRVFKELKNIHRFIGIDALHDDVGESLSVGSLRKLARMKPAKYKNDNDEQGLHASVRLEMTVR